MSTEYVSKPVTVPWVRAQKGVAPLTMLTAYDYPMATLLDHEGIDLLLVGDSVGTVIYGEPNTLSVTLEDILRHTQAVSRAAKRALVVADMPFMTYQISPEQAVANAGRLIKEGRAQAVKLEGGLEYADTIRAIVRAGIPVMAHLGLTPQSIHSLGSYRMHGKTDSERQYLIDSARAVSEAGAFSVVLECVQPELAAEITRSIDVPTIGIGSGVDCDGQVLVTHDLVGLTIGRVPKFVAPVADLKTPLRAAIQTYVQRTKAPLGGAEGLTRAEPSPTPPSVRSDASGT